jgi:hypothetical protein
MVNKAMDAATAPARQRLDDVARDVADDVGDEPGHRLLALGREGVCDAVEQEVRNATTRR